MHPEIHPTKIKQEAGYLVLQPHIVKPGQVQYLEFQDDDDSPLWITPEERESKRHSHLDEPTNVANKKANLQRDLQKSDESMTNLKVKKVGDLQDLDTLMNVVTVKRLRKERLKGYIDNTKGLLHILRERGFIDTNFGARSYYTLGGRNYRYRKTMLDTSLCNLMCNCIDLIKEETLIHTQELNMGDHPNCITVDRNPRCHPELAGEGIKYSWGCTNSFYRRLPLYEKRGRDNFH